MKYLLIAGLAAALLLFTFAWSLGRAAARGDEMFNDLWRNYEGDNDGDLQR